MAKHQGLDSAGLEIQDRDLALLTGLYESRVMTLDHIATLYFEGRREAAKKRVQKLKAARLLKERPRRSTQPAALHVTPQAIRLLDEHGALSGFPSLTPPALLKRTQVSDLTLRHELDVVSIKAAVSRAVVQKEHLRLVRFSTWPLLHQFTLKFDAKSLTTKPDGFFCIREQQPDGEVGEYSFFLEVDRSTEPQRVLAEKAAAYGRYYRSGLFAECCGGHRSEYAEYPFRVLFVVGNDERRNNAIEALLRNDPPTLTQVWLTTEGEALADPLGPIWMRPVDYRKTVAEIGISGERATPPSNYRRQATREAFVGQHVVKHRLLDE